MNTITPILLASANSAPTTISDFFWAFVIFLVGALTITFFVRSIYREHQKAVARINGASPTPNVDAVLAASRPQIIVNVPPDFKPIEPLPGDTSVEGQRAVLFYSVFKEALYQMNPGATVASEDEVDTAADVAERAVEACYGEGKGP